MREWLKKYRTDMGLTMVQMAEKLDISQPYYSYIESGERQRKMDISLAAKLAAIFGVGLEKIVELEGGK